MISTIRNALRMASTELDIISNNVANAGSTGFKRSDGNFLHFYNESTPMKGMNVGFGVVHEEPRRSDSKQGALKPTNNSLDLAVSGVGMFLTVGAGEELVTYTRDGSFSLDTAGRLITTDNRFVLDSEGRNIVIPSRIADGQGGSSLMETIQIADDGMINVTYGNGEIVQAGRIGLARFVNIAGLMPVGGGQFRATEKSGFPVIGGPADNSFGGVIQGHLEAANVNMTDELTKLMRAQQAYSGSSRLLQSAVEMSKRLTQ
ncbi:MAG: flagellar hook basal-body protein [Alphaproteobacteria bacterium]